MFDVIDFIFKTLFNLRGIVIILVFFYIIYYQKYFFGKGFKLIKRGKYEMAIDALHSRLEKRPNNHALHYGIGYCYYMLGYFRHAIVHFEKALELKIGRVETYFLLALAYFEVDKNFDKAYKLIQMGQNQQKKAKFFNKLADFEKNDMIGWVHYKRGNLDDAIKYYEIAINYWKKSYKKLTNKFQEENSPFFYRIGVVYMEKENIEEAIKYFKYSIEASPNSIFGQNSLEELKKLENGFAK